MATQDRAIAGEGSLTQGDYVGGAGNYTNLNSNDGDTSYLEGIGIHEYRHTYNMVDFTESAASITKVTVTYSTRRWTTSAELKSLCRIGSTNYEGIWFLDWVAGYNTKTKDYTTDPSTGLAWTPAGINTAEFGMVMWGGSNNVRVSYMKITVDYTPSSFTQKTISDVAALVASLGAKIVRKSVITSPTMVDTVSAKFTGREVAVYNRVLSESLSLISSISVTATQIYMRTLSEIVSVVDSITKALTAKRVMTEALALSDEMSFWSSWSHLFAEMIMTGEEAAKTISKTVTDSLSVGDGIVRKVWKSLVADINLLVDAATYLIQRIPVVTKLYLTDGISIIASSIVPQLTKLNLMDILSLIASSIEYDVFRIEIDMRLSTEPYLDITLSIEGGGDK